VVPRVHESGGRRRYCPLRSDVNHYLKWAFVEADLLRGLSREELAAPPEVDQAILGSVIRQITVLQKEIDGIEAWIARFVVGELGCSSC